MTQATNGHAPVPRASDMDRRIGQWLRRRRIDQGMTQAHLAELLDVTYQQMAKYERGLNRISAGRLLQTLAVLRVEFADFAAEIDGQRPAASTGPRMTSTARRVHERVARLSTAQQRSVLGMLEALAP